MFFISVNGSKKRNKLTFIFVLSAFVITAVLAVVLSLCVRPSGGDMSGYSFDAGSKEEIVSFLRQFSLDYSEEKSVREMTLPDKSDKVFAEYADFQSQQGFDIMKYSGKRVEEKLIKLNNQTDGGEDMYAQLLIYKGKVIGAHMTTFLQGEGLLPLLEIS